MAKEDVQTIGDSGNRKKVIAGVIAGVIILAVVVFIIGFNLSGGQKITRELSSTTVSPGETFTISYDISVKPGTKYYFFEDRIPNGFEILDCDHNEGNKIKIYDIKLTEDDSVLESKVKECKIKASMVPGSYAFTAEYIYDGSDSVEYSGSIKVQ